MSFSQKAPTIIAVAIAANIGGAVTHTGMYAVAAARYVWTSATVNSGQANFEWQVAAKAICGAPIRENRRDQNQLACHGAGATRPERDLSQGDEDDLEL